ncbi:nose resistant to fluoxetine protein 6-like [Dysidea avara]|uniref:nose resistant to fluoxetine protein 6-like n=1 Tax=Dysidea avara TaxID=196820 RepID=UPI0033252044
MIVYLLYLLSISNLVLANEQQFSTLFSVNINVSTSCQTAIQMLSSLEIKEPSVMAAYWDSWGKPSHGILKGHTVFLGNYDECRNLKDTTVGETKYCIYAVHMKTNSLLKPANLEDDVCLSSDCMETNKSIDIKVGVCYPSACSSDEFGLILSKMDITSVITVTNNPFSNMKKIINVKFSGVDISSTFCSQTDVEYESSTTGVIIVSRILIGLVVVGTSLDIALWLLSSNSPPSQSQDNQPSINHDTPTLKKSKEHTLKPEMSTDIPYYKPAIQDFILAFSLYNTVPNLLTTTKPPSAVKAVGGMKLIANFLIVTFHLYVFIPFHQPMISQNTPDYILPSASRFIFQPVMNVTFAADTFIFLSATLSAYLTLRDIEKHNGFRLVYFYLNRYFRLSVLFYFYTIISATIFVHFGQGPVWRHPDYTSCSNNWWYNVLYLTNMLELPDMCMTFSWNVCVDMQLFIISPVFILLLYKRPIIGLSAAILAMVGNTTAIGVVAANNEYQAAIFTYYNPKLLEQFRQLYAQPYFRVNVYLTGILLGYILYKKHSIANLSIGKWPKMFTCAILWCISAFLCSATLFGTYGELSGNHLFSNFENTVFLMFGGLAWSVGIFIIIYMCNTGYGGVVNSFLSWPGWEPLVRLSYSVYLVHRMVLFVILGTLHSSLIFTDTLLIVLLVATWMISYGVSAVVAVVVELPILRIVSLCFKLAGMNPRDK